MSSNQMDMITEFAMSMFQNFPSHEAQSQVAQIIGGYVGGSISYEECIAKVSQFTSNMQPVEKAKDLVEIDPTPIAISEGGFDGINDSARKKSRCWTTYEDDRLIAGIYRFGPDNWTSIAKFVGNGRTRSQCSQRWIRGLDPRICKEQWSKAEEYRLIQYVSFFGDKNWTQIAAKMGNRSDVQCRYRYKQLQKDQSAQYFPPPLPNPMGIRPSRSAKGPGQITLLPGSNLQMQSPFPAFGSYYGSTPMLNENAMKYPLLAANRVNTPPVIRQTQNNNRHPPHPPPMKPRATSFSETGFKLPVEEPPEEKKNTLADIFNSKEAEDIFGPRDDSYQISAVDNDSFSFF